MFEKFLEIRFQQFFDIFLATIRGFPLLWLVKMKELWEVKLSSFTHALATLPLIVLGSDWSVEKKAIKKLSRYQKLIKNVASCNSIMGSFEQVLQSFKLKFELKFTKKIEKVARKRLCFEKRVFP